MKNRIIIFFLIFLPALLFSDDFYIKYEDELSLDERLAETVLIGFDLDILTCLELGADPNYFEAFGLNLLWYSTYYKMKRISYYLLHYGAHSDVIGDNGKTPLMNLILLDDSTQYAEFIEHIKDSRSSDLDFEYIRRSLLIDSYLTEEILIGSDKQDIGDEKYLFIDDYLIQTLIDKSENLDIFSIEGKSVLMYALEEKQIEIAKSLYENSANIFLKDQNKETILSKIIKTKDLSLTDLIFSNETINKAYSFGDSILIDAIKANSWSLVDLFLTKEMININEINEKGESGLIIATKNNQYDIAEQLLKYGIDLNIKDNIGKTAEYYAYENNREDIVNMINYYRENKYHELSVETTDSEVSIFIKKYFVNNLYVKEEDLIPTADLFNDLHLDNWAVSRTFAMLEEKFGGDLVIYGMVLNKNAVYDENIAWIMSKKDFDSINKCRTLNSFIELCESLITPN